MSTLTDAELLRRGLATLAASWEAYAAGAHGAAVHRNPGVAIAVFPGEPERDVYNNALIAPDLGQAERAQALDEVDAAYAAAGIVDFAAWVHEGDRAMRADLERRGYTLDASTRAMGLAFEDIRMSWPALDLRPLDWDEYLRTFGLPEGLIRGADHAAFHVLVAYVESRPVTTAMAFDHNGDCGIYNVATLENARRRGLGTAVTAVQVHAAYARGCWTASLQSTPMAERVYGTVGFRDLGRLLEYVPRKGRPPGKSQQPGVAQSLTREFIVSGYVAPTEQLVTEILVRNVRRSTEFYRRLGFQLLRDAGEFVELTWEDHRLFLAAPSAFYDHSEVEPPTRPLFPLANVRVMVSDVDECWRRAQEMGAPVVVPIADKPYGLRDFTIADPDGFGIRFATRLE